jgi:hypothetical protein
MPTFCRIAGSAPPVHSQHPNYRVPFLNGTPRITHILSTWIDQALTRGLLSYILSGSNKTELGYSQQGWIGVIGVGMAINQSNESVMHKLQTALSSVLIPDARG